MSTRPMKAIFFANTEWYLFNFRLALAKHLRERGVEVVMMSPPGPYGKKLEAEGFRWIPVPMAFAAYLFFTDKKIFLQFSLTFVLVNMIGFIIYYVYPAAPPWYVQKYGAFFIAHTPGNSAGLQKFDDYFNAGIFKSIYAKGSNVFAAMPSLHSSYPLIVFYYGLKKKMGWVNIIFAIVMVGIWFAAVYTSHHYVLDVIAGITCAAAGILFFQKIGFLCKLLMCHFRHFSVNTIL